MPIQGPRLKLPRIREIVLRNFTLFSLERNIHEEVPKGVFCLAGANGIGKSTFLSIVNYGLTGIVPDPSQKFSSEEEYYKKNLEFPSDYFSGRIGETDRETAEIHLEFVVGKRLFAVTRGFFEQEQLRDLSIHDTDGPVTPLSGAATPGDLHNEYKRQLTEAIGLESFEQFVFLQSYVLTFDERRHLLFWDQKVLEQTLYLAFGVQPADAKEAAALRRQIERADSLGRNYTWQASQVRSRCNDLMSALGSKGAKESDARKVLEDHMSLVDRKDQLERKIEGLESSLRDCELKLNDQSVNLSILRKEYSRVFSEHVQERSSVSNHPFVVSSISEERCSLCGASGPEVVKIIHSRTNTNKCPLCDSKLAPKKPGTDGIAELKSVDGQITKTRKQIGDTLHSKERIESDLDSRRRSFEKVLSELEEFEAKNRDLLRLSQKMNLREMKTTLERYNKEIQELLSKRNEEYRRRDEKKRELRILQNALERRYAEAEETFVPLFKDLSNLFLGIDLDIRMEPFSQGLNLILDLKNTTRRHYHQLSESQRFFIDIALRMALIQYISDDGSKACLVIDTPEGSLDIAYESRAGAMLAKFALAGFQIIMTANINTSQLLIKLAGQCGRKRMRLVRMTPWVELSDVQVEEEGLFKKAFKSIENALG